MAYIGGGIEPGRGIGKREKQETWRNAKYIRPDAFEPGPPEGIDKMTKETSHVASHHLRRGREGDEGKLGSECAQTTSLSPKALAPAPAPPSQPKNRSPLFSPYPPYSSPYPNPEPLLPYPYPPYPVYDASDSPMRPSSDSSSSHPRFVWAHTDMNRIRFNLGLRKNQWEDHKSAPARRLRRTRR